MGSDNFSHCSRWAHRQVQQWGTPQQRNERRRSRNTINTKLGQSIIITGRVPEQGSYAWQIEADTGNAAAPSSSVAATVAASLCYYQHHQLLSKFGAFIWLLNQRPKRFRFCFCFASARATFLSKHRNSTCAAAAIYNNYHQMNKQTFVPLVLD